MNPTGTRTGKSLVSDFQISDCSYVLALGLRATDKVFDARPELEGSEAESGACKEGG